MITSEPDGREGLAAGEPAHDAAVAATARHVRAVIGTLRTLDLGTTAPAAMYHPGEERTVGTV
ncbi:hypothetical protein [Streptomyces abikoensis]|uniref:hypothetical protein n=1 Tax=Streptomyces abikoensis TaxID=97398 RepID=UPI0036A5DB91